MRRRRPRSLEEPAIDNKSSWSGSTGSIGIVLSGGGARAAYQIGALKALVPYLDKSNHPVKVIVGSSIGAINGLLFSACLSQGVREATSIIEDIWKERSFRNTFHGSPTSAFFKTIKFAILQYLAPGPNPNSESLFNPTPLMSRVDEVIQNYGGLTPEGRIASLESVAVMTTVEGDERKPLLFVSSHKEIESHIMQGASFDVCYTDDLHAKHGFASAALPSVLPPVELDTHDGTVHLIDGGIAQNVPVDPAVRLGAERVIVIDISGRDWWMERSNLSKDTRPKWEIPAEAETFCLRPAETFVIRPRKPLGQLLKNAVSVSKSKFISSVGPTWPIFAYLKNTLGEETAFETLSYVALDQDYIRALIERGYNDTIHLLHNREEPSFESAQTYEQMFEHIVDA